MERNCRWKIECTNSFSEAEREGGGVLGGMEVLQCYNPHRTEGFCTIGVLQRCYRGATGCYAAWP